MTLSSVQDPSRLNGHCTLENHLFRLIEEQGPLPVDRFQEIALYHPLKGYYATQPVLGRGGDFTTAPEVSQLFGEMLGLWLWDVWRRMDFPQPFQLVELGPGRGVLMADLLRTWSKLSPDGLASFERASCLSFLEISPLLQAQQTQTLQPFLVTPSWHQTLEDALSLSDAPLLVLANEFWDALPIKQFEYVQGTWVERGVGMDPLSRQLTFVRLAHPVKLDSLTAPFKPFEGAIVEHSPQGEAVFQTLIHALKRRGGVLWIADYGYTQPAFGSTLQGIYSGHVSPVLQHVGQTDLSAHVSFDRLKALACQHNLLTLGPIEQGVFLKKLGIQARLDLLKQGKSPKVRGMLEAGYQRLVHPLQMGSLFKIFGVSTHVDLAF